MKPWPDTSSTFVVSSIDSFFLDSFISVTRLSHAPFHEPAVSVAPSKILLFCQMLN
jgi:hypothetical protein